MRWFKQDFFKWTDKPPCHFCGAKSDKIERKDNGECTAEDLEWGAKRVEMYECTLCTTMLRFPRYNSVLKLLETRHGRCGEWANCFTAMCIALDH